MDPSVISQIPGLDELLAKVSSLQNTVCDEECRQNRENIVKFNEYQTSLENARTSIEQVKEAKKDFLIASRGITEYEAIERQQAERDASDVLQQLDSQFEQLAHGIRENQQTIAIQQNTLTELRDVSNVYTQRIQSLEQVYQDTENSKNISFREASLVENTIDTLHLWMGWMQHVYWFLVLIYSIVIFLIGQGFRQKRVWITLVLLLIFPHVIPWIMDWIPKKWWFHIMIERE